MKTYNDEEIDALVAEVQEQFLAPLLRDAQEEILNKAESGKKAPITGGSGDAAPKKGGMVKEEKLGDEMSAKTKSNKFTNFPVSKEEASMSGSSMSKEESSASSSSGSSMSKDEGTAGKVPPTMTEQSGGHQPLDAMPSTMKPHSGLGKDEGSASKSKPPEGSASHGAPPGGDEGGAPPAPAAEPAAAPAPDAMAAPAPAPEQGAGDAQSLEQAYCQLSDQDLQVHYEALKQALMQRMGGPAQDPGMGGMGQPSPEAAPAPAPEQKALTMSEKSTQDALAKSEEKYQQLEKAFADLVQVVELSLQPRRKAVTTMQEYVAKTEADRPSERKLTKSEVKDKLALKARDPKLAKSDADLITRFYLNGDVKLTEIEHLLK
jgi:hypothetical protein